MFFANFTPSLAAILANQAKGTAPASSGSEPERKKEHLKGVSWLLCNPSGVENMNITLKDELTKIFKSFIPYPLSVVNNTIVGFSGSMAFFSF